MTVILGCSLQGCIKKIVYPWHHSTMGINSSNRASLSKLQAVELTKESKRVTNRREGDKKSYGIAAGIDQVNEQQFQYVLFATTISKLEGDLGSFDLGQTVELPLKDALVLKNTVEEFMTANKSEISLKDGKFVKFSNTLDFAILQASPSAVRKDPQIQLDCSLLKSFKACRLILAGEDWTENYLLRGDKQINLFINLLTIAITNNQL